MSFVKKTSLSLFFLMPFLAFSQGIQWVENLNWQEIITKAKKENKYIFVDCYATWCKPCLKMDKEVYGNDTVGAFMNKRFVSVKVQGDKNKKDNNNIRSWYADAELINKKFKVVSYPTFLFFSPDGEIVHRATSYCKPAAFISLCTEATNPNKQYYVLLNNYNEGNRDYNLLPYLINMSLSLEDTLLVNKLRADYLNYLLQLPERDLYTKERIEFIAAVINNTTSKLFRLFYPNGQKVNSVMKQAGFARRVTDSVISREYLNPELSKTKDKLEPNWDQMYNKINERFGHEYAERNILWHKARWYDQMKDVKKYTEYFIEFVKKDGFDSTYSGSDGFLNWVGFVNIFQNSNDITQINAAINWMEGVVRRRNFNPMHYPMDTYAMLLYKGGRKISAIEWEKKALEIARLTNDKSHEREYEQKIEKMEKNEPTWPLTEVSLVKTDFSGNWRIKEQEMIYNNKYDNAVPQKMQIIQTLDSINILSLNLAAGGKIDTSVTKLSMSGNPNVSQTKNKRKKVQVFSWLNNGTILVNSGMLNFPDNEMQVEYKREELWWIEPKINSLTIVKRSMKKNKISGVWEDFYEIKAIYEKE